MKRSALIFAVSIIAITMASCQSVQTEQPTGYAGPPRSSAELAYQLSQQTWCSNDEAFSMMVLMNQDQDDYTSFAQRQTALSEMGIAKPDWQLNADDNVTKGTLAYMLCHSLDIKGGLLFQLTDLPRYAYREALYKNLMERGSEYEPLTGPEAVGIMSRAARFQE